MAVTRVSYRTDDITGEQSDDVQRRSYSVPTDGHTLRVTVDASESTDARVREAMDAAHKSYTKALRKSLGFLFDAEGATIAAATPTTSKSENGDAVPNENQVIREWARSNGYSVGDRGALPKNVKDAFAAAQSA